MSAKELYKKDKAVIIETIGRKMIILGAVYIIIGPADANDETIDYIDGGNAFSPY